jgi:hypothetical protein
LGYLSWACANKGNKLTLAVACIKVRRFMIMVSFLY